MSGTKGPMVKGHIRSFYGSVDLLVSTDGNLVRIELAEGPPNQSRYLHPDEAENFGRLLIDAAKVVRKRLR